MVNRARGDLLLRTVIALGLGLVFVALGWSAATSYASGNNASQTRTDLASLVSKARSQSRTRQPGGATILVSPSGAGSEMLLYDGLPDGRGQTLVAQRFGNKLTFSNATTFGLFFDEHGGLTALASYSGGTMAGPPTSCTQPYTIAEQIPTGSYQISLACEEDTSG